MRRPGGAAALGLVVALARLAAAAPDAGTPDAGAPRPKPHRFGERRTVIPVKIEEPLAVTAADLDGDGVAEIVVLGAYHVAVFDFAGELHERARAALSEPDAAVHPRTRIGALLVTAVDGQAGQQILAHTSDGASGGRFVLAPQGLVKRGRVTFYPLASVGEGAAHHIIVGDLTSGMDTFDPRQIFLVPSDPLPAAPLPLPPALETLEAVRAGADTWFGMVNATATLRVDRGQLGQTEARFANVGYAFELADLDGDGVPEAVTSDASAPGAADTLLVRHLKGGPPLLKLPFKGAAVVGIASGRLDGVNPAVIALLRRRTSKGTVAELVIVE